MSVDTKCAPTLPLRSKSVRRTSATRCSTAAWIDQWGRGVRRTPSRAGERMPRGLRVRMPQRPHESPGQVAAEREPGRAPVRTLVATEGRTRLPFPPPAQKTRQVLQGFTSLRYEARGGLEHVPHARPDPEMHVHSGV